MSSFTPTLTPSTTAYHHRRGSGQGSGVLNRSDTRHGLGYGLFVLTTCVLLVRPADLLPALTGLPIYEVLILATLAASLPAVLGLLTLERLRHQPLTCCVLGILVASVLSHLVHGDTWYARASGIEFSKVVLYYLLLIGLLTTWQRLRAYLLTIVVSAAILAGVALLQYHDFINLPSLTVLEDSITNPVTGEKLIVPRLRSVGIFNDPNDLCLLLLFGLAFAAYGVMLGGTRRLLGLGVMLLLGYAIALTESRGGLLALFAGAAIFFKCRYGWWKLLIFAAVGGPVLLAVFAGRQTAFDLETGTGQARIQHWSEGLALLRDNPLLGVGYDNYDVVVGIDAHNSFISTYGELGLFGGTLFLFLFALPVFRLYHVAGIAGEASEATEKATDEAMRLRPFLLAGVVAWGVGCLSLSRAYIVPTYLVIGVAASFLHLIGGEAPPRITGGGLVIRALVLGALFVISAYVFIRLFASWG